MPDIMPEIGTVQERVLRIENSGINVEKRTIEVAFSSEEPADREGYSEILDHSPGAADLSRLNNGGPFVYDHETDDYRSHIGAVIPGTARVDADRMGRATIKVSKSPEGQRFLDDAVEGIRTKVSLRYKYTANPIAQRSESGKQILRFPAWKALEISSVAMPVDDTVGIGRSQTQNKTQNIMPEEVKTPTVEEVTRSATERGIALENDRVSQITAIADRMNIPEVRSYAAKAIKEKTPVQEFQRSVIETHFKATPITTDPNIGMSGQEVKRYSICRAIIQSGEGRLDGLEKEASDAVAKIAGREAKGFYIPHDVAKRGLDDSKGLTRGEVMSLMANMGHMQRALNATTATAGGFTIGTDVLGSSLIELLRNKTLVNQLGVRTLSGLVGNIAIPKVSGGATTYWLSEDGTLTNSQQTFGQLGLTPHRLAALTAFNKQLLAQSSIDVEALVRDDLMRVLAIEKDRAFINGSGVSGEPLGIIGTTGINAITYGAATTWAKVVENETTLATSNADSGSIAFLTTPATRGKWKTNPKVTAQPIYLWENGMVNGYPAHATNQVPSDKTIFANWNDGIMAEWAGMDVVSDIYSRKKQGEIEVQITLMTDNGLRHPVSFVVSTDSGAQ